MVKLLLTLAVLLLALPAYANGQKQQTQKPNIVILLVDDAGFMDFGGYGGEAHTPNINQLGDNGVRFSNYHTSPLCAPSRAMMLTGQDNHKNGVGSIPEVLTKEQEGKGAYALHIVPGVETIADRMRGHGYQTFMTGKWHLGGNGKHLPNEHGFDRSFALDASGADNWEQKPFMPFYAEAPWYEDGQPATLPEDFYSSRFLVDQMIDYLNERDTNKPFLAYVAFQAVHIPVQAPREFTDHYEGVYAAGWRALQQSRFARAQNMGLVPKGATPPASHPLLRKWEDLSADDRAYYERAMMVNAGMLEAMDHHIGRLISYLESKGDLENTIFVVTSDNGPEFGNPVLDPVFRLWMKGNGYHTDLDGMGEKGSMGAIGAEWASAAAAPGSLFKMYASEGGARVPLIIQGPGVKPAQGFNAALTFVTDIAPTLIDLAGGTQSAAMDGRSLSPLLKGKAAEVYGPNEAIGLEVAGNAALYKGQYKLVKNTRPHGDATWRLHDLHTDPAEQHDLSQSLPDLRTEMLLDYNSFASSMGVVALPDDFDISEQISINGRNKMLRRAQPTLIQIAFGIFGFLFLFFVIRRIRRN